MILGSMLTYTLNNNYYLSSSPILEPIYPERLFTRFNALNVYHFCYIKDKDFIIRLL